MLKRNSNDSISIKYYLNKCHVTYYMQTSPCKIFPKTYFAKISEKTCF